MEFHVDWNAWKQKPICWFKWGDDALLSEFASDALKISLGLRMPHEVKWKVWLFKYFTKQQNSQLVKYK